MESDSAKEAWGGEPTRGSTGSVQPVAPPPQLKLGKTHALDSPRGSLPALPELIKGYAGHGEHNSLCHCQNTCIMFSLNYFNNFL